MRRIGTVLRVRRLQEDLAKAAHAASTRAFSSALSKQESWEAMMAEHGSRDGVLTAGAFATWRSALQSGSHELTRLCEATALADARRQDTLAGLLAASKAAESIQRLSDRIDEAERAEMLLREQREIDEAASRPHETTDQHPATVTHTGAAA